MKRGPERGEQEDPPSKRASRWRPKQNTPADSRPPSAATDRTRLSLRAGVVGLGAVASLRDLAGKALADAFNVGEVVPPKGWHGFVVAGVLPHLKPRLFLEFVAANGGVEGLRKETTPCEFQQILHALFRLVGNWSSLPLHCKPRCANQILKAKRALEGEPLVRHDFYRLGLKHAYQFDASLLLTWSDPDRENRLARKGTDSSFWILCFYTGLTCAKKMETVRFDLDAADAQRLSDRGWTVQRQKLFEPHFDQRVKADVPRLRYDAPVVCFRMLAAMEIALARGRYHSAFSLAALLLTDGTFSSCPLLRHFRFYCLRSIALSCAAFNARIDVSLAFLERMREICFYPSDYQTFVSAKIFVCSSYGLFKSTVEIFEAAVEQGLFLKQGILFKDSLVSYANACLRMVENFLAEAFCAGTELTQANASLETWCKLVDILRKKTSVSKNVLARAEEILAAHREDPEVPESTKTVLRYLSFERALLRALLRPVLGNTDKAISDLRKLARRSSIPKSSLFYLVRFVADKSRHDLNEFRTRFAKEQRDLGESMDFQNSFNVAHRAFLSLTVLVGSHVFTSCLTLTDDLCNLATCCYAPISSQQDHPRTEILKRMNLIFQRKPRGIGKNLLDLTRSAANRRFQNLDETAALSEGSFDRTDLNDSELLNHFFARDRYFMTSLATFGLQSVQNCRGV